MAVSWADNQKLNVNYGATVPVIDGVKDPSWESRDENVNVTDYDFSGNRSIRLYTKHSDWAVYFLVEVKFESTNFQYETMSIYISNFTAPSAQNFTDKKQITISGANKKDGSDTYTSLDLHNTNHTTWTLDATSSSFKGAGKVQTNGSNIGWRFYEYQMNFSAPVAENVPFILGNSYAIKFGLNNSNDPLTEVVSTPLNVTLIMKNLGGSTVAGEYKFDPKIFIQVVMIIIACFVGLFGVLVLVSKRNINLVKTKAVEKEVIKEEEEEPEPSDENEKESK
jgi:hypothetical protein